MNPERASFDLLILNGLVVDGSGSEPRRADVGVRGGRIAALGRLAGAGAGTVVDAGGLTVAPGFIDVHTHDDQAVFTRAGCAPKLSQGVTSVVVGSGGDRTGVRQRPPGLARGRVL